MQGTKHKDEGRDRTNAKNEAIANDGKPYSQRTVGGKRVAKHD